jgi:hypothetical protein
MKKAIQFSALFGLLAVLCLIACEKVTDTPTANEGKVAQTITTPGEVSERGIQQPVPVCNCGVTVRLQASAGSPFPFGARVRIYKRSNCSDPLCTYLPTPVVTLTGTTPRTLPNVGCNSCYTAVGDYENIYPVDLIVTNINGPVNVGTIYDSDNVCHQTKSIQFSASATCDAN